MHFFKQEMGLTIRRYVLWQRKLLAMKRMAVGDSITTAAHTAGFADAAHLTRTYRQLSGVSPSEIWQNSRFVQVNDCSSK
jgi:AraC-like DNA-binding protein